MQVSSTSNTSPASVPLSLQSTARGNLDRPVAPVSSRSATQDYAPTSAKQPPVATIELDAGTEKKLSRIKEVQVAFRAALNIADSIESQFLLEPII